jgi:hypothetical protein
MLIEMGRTFHVMYYLIVDGAKHEKNETFVWCVFDLYFFCLS